MMLSIFGDDSQRDARGSGLLLACNLGALLRGLMFQACSLGWPEPEGLKNLRRRQRLVQLKKPRQRQRLMLENMKRSGNSA